MPPGGQQAVELGSMVQFMSPGRNLDLRKENKPVNQTRCSPSRLDLGPFKPRTTDRRLVLTSRLYHDSAYCSAPSKKTGTTCDRPIVQSGMSRCFGALWKSCLGDTANS